MNLFYEQFTFTTVCGHNDAILVSVYPTYIYPFWNIDGFFKNPCFAEDKNGNCNSRIITCFSNYCDMDI